MSIKWMVHEISNCLRECHWNSFVADMVGCQNQSTYVVIMWLCCTSRAHDTKQGDTVVKSKTNIAHVTLSVELLAKWFQMIPILWHDAIIAAWKYSKNTLQWCSYCIITKKGNGTWSHHFHGKVLKNCFLMISISYITKEGNVCTSTITFTSFHKWQGLNAGKIAF